MPTPHLKTSTSSAVGRGDREQVQQHRLQRQQQRAEGAHQQEVGQHEHGEHEPREHVVRAVDEVHALRRAAAGEHAHAAPASAPPGRSSPRSRWTKSCAGSSPYSCLPGDDDLRVAAARVDERPRRAGTRRRRPRGRAAAASASRRDRRAAPPARAPAGAAGVDDDLRRRERARRRRASLSMSKPRTACGCCGIPAAEPGVSLSAKTGIAAATSSAPPAARKSDRPPHDRARRAAPRSRSPSPSLARHAPACSARRARCPRRP